MMCRHHTRYGSFLLGPDASQVPKIRSIIYKIGKQLVTAYYQIEECKSYNAHHLLKMMLYDAALPCFSYMHGRPHGLHSYMVNKEITVEL